MTTPTHDRMPDLTALDQSVTPVSEPVYRFSYEKVSSLLRLLGAAVLLASLSIFLFQGWLSSGDLYRFAVLIGFSALLSGAGLASSHVIGDNVSARLFMAIALCAVVADFAVAGGLVYSTWDVQAAGRPFPTFATWRLASGATTAAAVTAACIVLTPIVWMVMRALARQTATFLTRLFLLACAGLLVPVRDENIIAPGWHHARCDPDRSARRRRTAGSVLDHDRRTLRPWRCSAACAGHAWAPNLPVCGRPGGDDHCVPDRLHGYPPTGLGVQARVKVTFHPGARGGGDGYRHRLGCGGHGGQCLA